MQTTVAAGYLPPTDLYIQSAADNASLKLKAPEFIRDVCNINAGGKFLTSEEINKKIMRELELKPITRGSNKNKPFSRTDRDLAYETYQAAETAFIKSHEDLAQKMRNAIEMLPAMDVPGGSPMEKAINLLKILAAQTGEEEAGEGKHENEFLRELLSQSNLAKAKKNIKEAQNLSAKERDLLKQLADLKKQSENKSNKAPPPPGSAGSDNPGDAEGSNKNGGTKGKGIADGTVTGKTDKGQQQLDSILQLTDKQLGMILRVSRKLKAFSKLRTSKISKFEPDAEGEEVRNRSMKSFDEISKLKGHQFGQKTIMPKLFNYRTVTNQYAIRERGKFVEKKQLLYVLVDCSGSMQEDDNQRINKAAGILVNRLMAVADGDAELFWRFFDTRSHEFHHVTNKEEAHASIMQVMNEGYYNGGGTNFTVAISDAVSHIESIKDTMQLAKPEIFMVTDGSCSCKLKAKDLKGIKLHAAIVARNGSDDLPKLVEDTGGLYIDMSAHC